MRPKWKSDDRMGKMAMVLGKLGNQCSGLMDGGDDGFSDERDRPKLGTAVTLRKSLG
jgi:hypothetical protein